VIRRGGLLIIAVAVGDENSLGRSISRRVDRETPQLQALRLALASWRR